MSADRGFRQGGEALADEIPGADVGRRGRARRLADRFLVDDHQLAEAFEAGERGEGGLAQMGDRPERFLAREAVLLLGDGRANRGREQVGDQRGLTGAGHAAHDGQAADGDLDVEALEVAERSVLQPDPLGRGAFAGDRSARTAERMRDGLLEEAPCHGVGAFLQRGRRALRHDRAAVDAGARPHVDDQVGRAHGVFVVFDDQHRVAAIPQVFERADEAVVVARVQADARLVEHVERAGERRAELRREADALGFAAGERVGAAVEREVAEADRVEEAEAGGDLGEQRTDDGFLASLELESGKEGEGFVGLQAQQAGQGKRAALRTGELHRAADGPEAFAVAGRADGVADAVRDGVLIDGLFFVRGERRDLEAVAAAVRAPAAGGVPRKVLRVDLREGLARGGVAARGREIGDLPAVGGEEHTCVLAGRQGLADERAEGFLAGLFGLVGQADQPVGAEFAEDRVDVVFGIAVEAFEALDLKHLTVAAEQAEPFRFGPLGERAVVALAGANERGGDEQRAFLQGLRLLGDQADDRVFRHLLEWFAGGRAVQHAGPGEEHAQVLGDFGDRRDGGFRRAARHALFDRDRGRQTCERIDVRLRELFDELARIGRDAFQEATLAFSEEDVESQGGFTRARDAGHHRERAVRDLERDVLQVMFAGAAQGDRGRTGFACRGRCGGEGLVTLGEEAARDRAGAGDVGRRAFRDEAAAGGAGFRAHLQQPVARLQYIEVVFHHDERMAGFGEAVQQSDQPRHVLAVQAGGRFVKEQQCAALARVDLGKVADQLEALGFAPGKRRERLAHRQVAEADFFEAGELGGGRRAFAEELARLSDGHREQVADGLPVVLEAEHLVAEAFPVAGRAGQGDVGDELHLDGLPTRAAAAFAAAFAGVEGEVRGREPGGLRLGRIAEQRADRVPGADVERRIGARCARRGRLVDERDLGRLLVELHPLQFRRYVA